MICGGGALGCGLACTAEAHKRTIVGRNGPVFVKWTAPDGKVQDFHDDEAEGGVACNGLDGQVLIEAQADRSAG